MTRIPAPRFDLSSTVYILPGAEQPGQVTGYIVRMAAGIPYLLYLVTTAENGESECSDFQLTSEKSYGDGGTD